jgi:hypothetical protein
MWSADCICCSPDTVQQASSQSFLACTPPRKGIIVYVKCRCCGSKVCSFCVSGLEETVAECNKRVPIDDPSIVAIKSMSFRLKSHDQPEIDFGICCAFSRSIPTCTKSTIFIFDRTFFCQSQKKVRSFWDLTKKYFLYSIILFFYSHKKMYDHFENFRKFKFYIRSYFFWHSQKSTII